MRSQKLNAKHFILSTDSALLGAELSKHKTEFLRLFCLFKDEYIALEIRKKVLRLIIYMSMEQGPSYINYHEQKTKYLTKSIIIVVVANITEH